MNTVAMSIFLTMLSLNFNENFINNYVYKENNNEYSEINMFEFSEEDKIRFNDYFKYYVNAGDFFVDYIGKDVSGSGSFYSGHAGLIVDKKTVDGETILTTIEANPTTGVSYKEMNVDRFKKSHAIFRVKNLLDEDIENVLYFAEYQIGDSYSILEKYKSSSINDDKWYCSELVYACFNYIGICLDDKNSSNWIYPEKLGDSDNVCKIVDCNCYTFSYDNNDGTHSIRCDGNSINSSHNNMCNICIKISKC